MTEWRLACLDMAGTTIRDDGLVEQAFTVAFAGEGVAPGTQEHERMLAWVRKSMGHAEPRRPTRRSSPSSSIRKFEEAYGLLVDEGAVPPIPVAIEAIKALRHAGVKVALTTGFGRSTQEAIVSALGWWSEMELVLSRGGAGRFPNLVLVAAHRLGVEDVGRVAAVGDTPLDLIAGKRAGAGLLAAVLTGAGDRPALRAARAPEHAQDRVSLSSARVCPWPR